MGQNKIDTEFRQKLREREIAPKAETWDKLNARLENNKRSGSYKWILGIAASLVAGILIIGQVYRTDLVEETPAVVETPVEIQEENTITEEQQNSQLVTEEIPEPIIEEEILNKKPLQNTSASGKDAVTYIVYEVEEDSGESVIAEVAEVTTEETTEALPSGLEEVIAAVSSNLAENEDLAEAEVDSLLMMAASRISRERTSYLAGEQIDAESLLWDVEMEMEQSFREKVFDIMKEGYLKARTAVANRNF